MTLLEQQLRNLEKTFTIKGYWTGQARQAYDNSSATQAQIKNEKPKASQITLFCNYPQLDQKYHNNFEPLEFIQTYNQETQTITQEWHTLDGKMPIAPEIQISKTKATKLVKQLYQ